MLGRYMPQLSVSISRDLMPTVSSNAFSVIVIILPSRFLICRGPSHFLMQANCSMNGSLTVVCAESPTIIVNCS